MDYGIVHSRSYKTIVVKVEMEMILVERYYENGRLKFKGEYKEMPRELQDEPIGTKLVYGRGDEFDTSTGTKEGMSKWYHDNGLVFKKVYYTKGLEDGPVKIYHSSGALMESGEIEMGKRIGTWEYYTNHGTLYKKEHYSDSGSEEELL